MLVLSRSEATASGLSILRLDALLAMLFSRVPFARRGCSACVTQLYNIHGMCGLMRHRILGGAHALSFIPESVGSFAVPPSSTHARTHTEAGMKCRRPCAVALQRANFKNLDARLGYICDALDVHASVSPEIFVRLEKRPGASEALVAEL
ncbi:hypothetical protein BD309DRAFT_398645 [Dichomitus squalens]|uniref:Uncharacterized protein n=1 Tax=Dichomitus squalens TaxID=114155 RepID=A0A4Q9NKR0_9APHY|nr:hypothetical protein BD309DRAFT_398645 [Dichomitus squalens]TBU64574.1 hypothetical protein BD310DRAFT_404025 [Dichomitus squalens]